MQTSRHSVQKPNTISRLSLAAPVLLLLMFALSRMYHLLVLPVFLDEASHITRAQWVWQGQPLYLLTTGKVLAPYLMAVFWPFQAGPLIGRFVVVLIEMVGIAACYGVGKQLHSRQAGLLAMAFWILCPQLMFYERMALVDTNFASMAMLALWFAIRMIRSGRVSAAIWCGVVLALTVLAKLTGLVFLPIPIMVFVLVSARIRWSRRIKLVALAYVICGLLLIAPFLYVRGTDEDPTGVKYGLTSVDTNSLAGRIQENAARIFDADRSYLSDGMLVVIALSALGALILRPRAALLLIALTAAPLVAIAATAVSLWLRYASAAAPFMLLLTAVGLVALVEKLRRWHFPYAVRLLPWLVAGVWGLVVAVPFQLTAYADPSRLPLPSGDVAEYIQWVPSGYGIRDAVTYMERTITTPHTIIVTAANCDGARMYVPYNSPLTLLCPGIDWGGHNEGIMQDIRDRANRDGSLYVLGEDATMVPENTLPHPLTLIESFPRPMSSFTVKLYLIPSVDTSDQP